MLGSVPDDLLATKQGLKDDSKKPSKARIAKTGLTLRQNARPSTSWAMISTVLYTMFRETHTRPNDHRVTQDLCDWEFSDHLVDNWLSDDDTDPEEGGRKGVVLTCGTDMFLPPHDGGGTQSAFVEGLSDVRDAHDWQQAVLGQHCHPGAGVSTRYSLLIDHPPESLVLGFFDVDVGVDVLSCDGILDNSSIFPVECSLIMRDRLFELVVFRV